MEEQKKTSKQAEGSDWRNRSGKQAEGSDWRNKSKLGRTKIDKGNDLRKKIYKSSHWRK